MEDIHKDSLNPENDPRTGALPRLDDQREMLEHADMPVVEERAEDSATALPLETVPTPKLEEDKSSDALSEVPALSDNEAAFLDPTIEAELQSEAATLKEAAAETFADLVPESSTEPTPKQELLSRIEATLANIASEVDAAVEKVESLRSVRPEDLSQMSVKEIRSLQEQLKDCEQSLEKAVEAAKTNSTELVDKIVPDAKYEYKARSGFLDQPSHSGAAAVTAAVLGTAVTVAIIATIVHPPLGAALHGLVEMLPAALHGVGSFLGHVALFTGYFFTTCKGTAEATKLWGAFKKGMGDLVDGEGVKSARNQAEEVQTSISEKLGGSLSAITRLREGLEHAAEHKELLRAAISKSVVETDPERRSEKDDALLQLAYRLDNSEVQQLMKLIVTELKLVELRHEDIRPPKEFGKGAMACGPEAAAATLQKIHDFCEHLEGHYSKWKNIKGGTLEVVRDVNNLLKEARDNLTTHPHQSLIAMLGAIARPLTATGDVLLDSLKQLGAGGGLGLSGVEKMLVENGTNMIGSLKDTVKGFFGLGNLGKDKSHGPNLLQLVGMVLAVDRFKKGEVLKAIGELGPNLALAVWKKMYFIIKAERDARGEGNIKAPGPSILGIIGQATAGAVGKVFVEAPLTLFAALERNLPIGREMGLPINKALSGWYGFRQGIAENGMTGKGGTNAMKALIPNGDKLDAMSYPEFVLHAMTRIVAFTQGDRSVSTQEVYALKEYWKGRDTAEWLKHRQHDNNLRAEIIEKDPRLTGLWEAVRHNRQWQKGEAKPESETDLQSEHAPANPRLRYFISSFNKRNARDPQPITTPQILDCGDDGRLIMKTTDGNLKLIDGTRANAELLAMARGKLPAFDLPLNADRPRLVTVGYMLGRELEFDQREALVQAHYDLHKGDDSRLDKHVQNLLESGFERWQLFGNASFPGLFKLGLIGNRVPSEEALDKSQKSVKPA